MDVNQSTSVNRISGEALTPDDSKISVTHLEAIGPPSTLTQRKWKVSRTGDADTAIALFNDPSEVHDPLDLSQEHKVMRKVDWMILPYLCVCYSFFYIDKTTLSYAAIFDIKQDLHLVGTQYSWLSSIFYFGFLAWAFPTNFLLQRLPIGKYLGINIFIWGLLLMLQAVARNFADLATLRAFGGAAEACADPAFMLITSMWYTRREQPLRLGLWYSSLGLGISGGGLLGYGIGHLRGTLPSWKYEFLIIGALCSAWGIVMFFFLPDSPVNCRQLSEEEKRIVVERLRENQTGVENKHIKWYQIKEAFGDYKVFLLFMMGLCQSVVNGGITNFGTLIIQGFGFSTLITTLMQVPYGVLISIVILVCVYTNDKLPPNNRCVMILIFLLPNIAGAFGLRYVPQHHQIGRLMCYYLTGFYNASFVLILSLCTANVAGHTKKVVTSACLFLGYCTGNLAGPFFYKTDQAPYYNLGIWSMIVSHLIEVVVIITMRELLRRENIRRDRLQGILLGYEADNVDIDLNATAFSDMTDKENPNFRYIY
ncbi:related to allantoate permease [Phialocephala subalpina]|uniref:Related to allantoate permease n=1 Tax=Phialocephala subalpina TaxID=576137 RepID=A0A1L7XUB2_9HELO|nr:related to allantoate permease [Phialocephala subalpina]